MLVMRPVKRAPTGYLASTPSHGSDCSCFMPSEMRWVSGLILTISTLTVSPTARKQLQSAPWDGVEAKYPVGARFTGRITNITDYGAFVELEPGVEGLVHVSEMSWTKKNVHPGKIVSTSQEVD